MSRLVIGIKCLIFIRQSIMIKIYLYIWLLKPDSAPVRGDGYEPGLRSSDPEPM